jgi:hypothetical protein
MGAIPEARLPFPSPTRPNGRFFGTLASPVAPMLRLLEERGWTGWTKLERIRTSS